MDKFNSKDARKLLTLPTLKNLEFEWNLKWDHCEGGFEMDEFVVSYYYKDKMVKKVVFSKDTYNKEIRASRNVWIKNKILNRSELAGRIWREATPNNRLRRRLEQKAFWGTFTEEEKKHILENVAELYEEVKRSLKDNPSQN